jgi:hypothetical protein
VPFLFRPDATYDGSWTLIGESYVHGITFGEALQADDVQFGTIELV